MVSHEEGEYCYFCLHYNEPVEWNEAYLKKGKPDSCKVTKIIVEENNK